MMLISQRCALSLLPLVLISTAGIAQDTLAVFGYTWQIRGDVPLVEDYLGQVALRLRSTQARLRDLEFENGTIEFDIATSGDRSFIGVGFRVSDSGRDFEDFYLRPHNSGRFDALQYTPMNNGISAWQLYPEHNATFAIPRDRWLHVKLEIAGQRLAVYLDHAATPTMVVHRLKRGHTRGSLTIRASFPEGEQRSIYPTAFANFTVALTGDGGDQAGDDPTPSASGFVDRWAISPSKQTPATPIESIPPEWLDAAGWSIIEADSRGRVNLAEQRAIPAQATTGTVLARVTIHSDGRQVKKFQFGFSDRVSVFLNGRLVFTGNNTYRSRSQRYLGVMTVDNDALYLDLEPGENELIMAVTEAFGGWGLIARMEDRGGISMEARVASPGPLH